MFESIEKSYLARSESQSDRMRIWENLSLTLPPLLTRESGDFALSIQWIVQATIVRGIHQALIKLNAISDIPLKNDTIGALAHSENPNKPFVIEKIDNILHISGEKSYITGGNIADFLMITGKSTNNGELSLIILNKDDLPPNSITELNLPNLKTTDHGKLTINSTQISLEHLIKIDNRDLKRILKKQSLLEKTLIIEAAFGLIIYLNRVIGEKFSFEPLNHQLLREIMSSIEKSTEINILASQTGDKLSMNIDNIKSISEMIEKINHYYNNNTLPSEIEMRIKDLNFIKNFLPKN